MQMNNMKTFIACDNCYEEAKLVVFGAAFDGTTSFRPGTRFATNAMRSESDGIETYSPYQDMDLEDILVCDVGDLEFPFGNPNEVLNIISEFTKDILNDGKVPVMIGGEHLVTLGAAREVVKKYNDVCFIHFDAHADLRDDYLGEKLSHATVMRRVWDLVGDNKIFQFGIRSGSKEEIKWGKDHVYTNFFNLENLDHVLNQIQGKPVYVTIDLDVLDPSIFPGTGTPEAGGVTYKELIDAILKLKKMNVVACDINELSPHYDLSGTSTAVACKTLREVLLAFYKN